MRIAILSCFYPYRGGIAQFNAVKEYAMIIATQGDILPMPVVAADESLDITDALIEGLNAAYVKEKGKSE